MPDIQLKLSRTCGCQVDINLNQALFSSFPGVIGTGDIENSDS